MKKHLVWKIIAVVLAFCIVLGSVSCALVYFDVVDIPFIAKIIGKENEDSHFTNLEGKFTDIKITDEKSAIEAVASVGKQIGIENAEKDLKVESVNKVDGDSYYRMQQYYNDIPVYGKSVIVSADKDGNASSLTANTELLKKNITFDSKLTDEKVKEQLDSYVKDNFENVSPENITVKSLNDGEKVVYNFDNKCEPAYKLYAEIDGMPYEVVVSAKNGKVLNADTMLKQETVTCYNRDGSESFIGSRDDDGYKMFDEEKQIAIYTYKGKNSKKKGVNISLLLSDDSFFGNTKAETGYDTDGIAFLRNINNIYNYYNERFNDKAYEGLYACYDDGYDGGKNALGGSTEDGNGYLSMGKKTGVNAIDTMGHEYTHIVTRHKQGSWITNNEKDETGAINEGYSDIFGELIEAELNSTDGNEAEPNWEHGDRIMHNPEQNNYPAKANSKKLVETKFSSGIKLGIDVKGGTTDFAHGYSTVISHAAYLMWNGINGTEDFKINSEKLAKLWYRALLMMPSDATFAQCAYAVETAAWQMYRDGEQLTIRQVACVRYAFQKVGIMPSNSTACVKSGAKLYVKNKDMELTGNYHVRISFVPKSPEISLKSNSVEKIKEKDLKTIIDTDVNNSDGFVLELKEGLYLITVSDISENGSKKTFKKLIGVTPDIAGINNGDNEVTIYTDFGSVEPDETTTQPQPTEPPEPKNLEATDKDIENLEIFLEDVMSFDYDYKIADNKDLVDIILDPIYPSVYEYFFDDFKTIHNDPLNKLQYYDDSRSCSVDNICWIAENIFNKKMDKDHMNYDDLSTDGQAGTCYAYNGVFYRDYGGAGDLGHATDITNYKRQPDGTYNILCDFYEINLEADNGSDRNVKGDFEETKYINAALRMINGKKYWTFYKVSQEKFFEIGLTQGGNSSSFDSESELKATFAKAVSKPIREFSYGDFDGNGTKEAFVLTGEPDDLFGVGWYSDVTVWFVNSGNVTEVYNFQKYDPKGPSGGYMRDVIKVGNKMFFLFERSGGGSGSITYIWYVSGGKPWSMHISGQYMDFGEKDGKYIGYTSEFNPEGGHGYVPHEFRYDESRSEFVEEK